MEKRREGGSDSDSYDGEGEKLPRNSPPVPGGRPPGSDTLLPLLSFLKRFLFHGGGSTNNTGLKEGAKGEEKGRTWWISFKMDDISSLPPRLTGGRGGGNKNGGYFSATPDITM